MGIIHKGGLVATGTLADLRERVDQNASLEEVFLKVTDEAPDQPAPASQP